MKKNILQAIILFTIIFGLTQQATAQDGPREWVRGGAVGVKCFAPGNREQIRYDWGPGSRFSATEEVMVGSNWGINAAGNSYRCMGRCGSNCWSAPTTSRMYTKDCLAHDVCSFRQNSSGGGSDSNCGDEFRAAIGDTALSLINICRYRRGGHTRAARGVYKQ